MLAAEELGGPVVGDMMDIDGQDLEAGFNAQGKLKKSKTDQSVDKSQRRMDEFLEGGESRGNHQLQAVGSVISLGYSSNAILSVPARSTGASIDLIDVIVGQLGLFLGTLPSRITQIRRSGSSVQESNVPSSTCTWGRCEVCRKS